MIEPGRAFIGLDLRGHLWFAVSRQSADGAIVMANITTHWPDDPDHRACRIVGVERRGPASPALLRKLQLAALESPYPDASCKTAIRISLQQA